VCHLLLILLKSPSMSFWCGFIPPQKIKIFTRVLVLFVLLVMPIELDQKFEGFVYGSEDSFGNKNLTLIRWHKFGNLKRVVTGIGCLYVDNIEHVVEQWTQTKHEVKVAMVMEGSWSHIHPDVWSNFIRSDHPWRLNFSLNKTLFCMQ